LQPVIETRWRLLTLAEKGVITARHERAACAHRHPRRRRLSQRAGVAAQRRAEPHGSISRAETGASNRSTTAFRVDKPRPPAPRPATSPDPQWTIPIGTTSAGRWAFRTTRRIVTFTSVAQDMK
jgi:hypothetical protein